MRKAPSDKGGNSEWNTAGEGAPSQADSPLPPQAASTIPPKRVPPGQKPAATAAAGQKPAAIGAAGQKPAATGPAGQKPAATGPAGQKPAATRAAGQKPAATVAAGPKPGDAGPEAPVSKASAFKAYDEGEKKHLTAADLRRPLTFTSGGDVLDDAPLARLIGMYDPDRDGVITPSEWELLLEAWEEAKPASTSAPSSKMEELVAAQLQKARVASLATPREAQVRAGSGGGHD